MSNVKKAIISLLLLILAAIFWLVPDPLPLVDEIIVTLAAIGGIGKQLRGINMKDSE